MTGSRARGAIVLTYWSVLVTVRIAHTLITETGISSDASTTSTHAEIRRGRCPRRAFFGFAPFSAPPAPESCASPGTSGTPGASGVAWGSVSLIRGSPSPNA